MQEKELTPMAMLFRDVKLDLPEDIKEELLKLERINIRIAYMEGCSDTMKDKQTSSLTYFNKTYTQK